QPPPGSGESRASGGRRRLPVGDLHAAPSSAAAQHRGLLLARLRTPAAAGAKGSLLSERPPLARLAQRRDAGVAAHRPAAVDGVGHPAPGAERARPQPAGNVLLEALRVGARRWLALCVLRAWTAGPCRRRAPPGR